MQAFNARSLRCRRPPFFFSMTYRGDAHGLFTSRITSCSVIVSNPAFTCLRRSEARRRGSLKTESPGVVFDMMYHAMSYFVSTEGVDESHPKIQRDVGDTSTYRRLFCSIQSQSCPCILLLISCWSCRCGGDFKGRPVTHSSLKSPCR